MGNAAGTWQRIRRAAKAFVFSGGPRRDRWQRPEVVMERLAPAAGARVADLGAGGGYFTFRLAEAVGPEGVVYAVDVDPDLRSLIADRAAAEAVGNVVPVAAQPTDPGLPEPVDLALVVDAFHHLPDPPTYLRQLATYLRPGARVVVIEPRPRWYLLGHATDPARIEEIMQEAGYGITDRHPVLTSQSFLVFHAPQ